MSRVRAIAVAAGVALVALSGGQPAHAVAWSDIIANGSIVDIRPITPTHLPAPLVGQHQYGWQVTFYGGSLANPKFDQFLAYGPGVDYTGTPYSSIVNSASLTWSNVDQNPDWAAWYKGGPDPASPVAHGVFEATFNGALDPTKTAIHVRYGQDQSGWFTTPEPGLPMLLGMGLLGLIRRRRSAASA